MTNLITLGRGHSNDIQIDHPTISLDAHLYIDIDLENGIVLHHNGENDSLINGFSFQRTDLKHEDELIIGAYMISGSNLIKRINRIYYKDKQDLSIEYHTLLNTLRKYEILVSKVKKKSNNPKIIRVTIIIIGFLFLHLSSIIDFLGSSKYMVYIVIATIASWLAGLFNFSKKIYESLEDINLQYQDKLLCPKCGYKMSLKSSYAWIKKGSCFGEKCDAIFKSTNQNDIPAY